MQPKIPGKLRPIYQVEKPASTGSGIDIVVIPAVWIGHLPGRATSQCCWVKPLLACATSNTRVFLFDYQIKVDGSSLWEQLLRQSNSLVTALDESRIMPGDRSKPILFICHSLGGLIAKKALTLGTKSRQPYADVLAGIVFLGTPHLVTSHAEGWSNLKSIMKANSKVISKDNMTDYEMEELISTCRQFENLQLHTPVLSVYERRVTKFRDNLFNAIRRKNNFSEVLVTKSMVEVNGSIEALCGVDKAHLDLCDVEEQEPFYEPLCQYLSNVLQHAQRNAQDAFGEIQGQEFINLNLRPKCSFSSFTGLSSHTPQITPLDTPGTESNGEIVQNSDTTQDDPVNFSNLPHTKGVQLPFSHLASVSRNSRFFGRSDVLDAIDHAFQLNHHSTPDLLHPSVDSDSPNVPRVYVLCGMAGIGKTEIAIEYVYSRSDEFDAIMWIYTDTTAKLGTQFVAIAKELGKGSTTENMDEVEAREIVKAWLAAPVGYQIINGNSQEVSAKWLIVFDNADIPDVLYDWLPDQGPGCILVTSKYPYTRENTYRLENGHDIEPLSPEIGSEMLLKLSGREQEAGAVEASTRIAKSLGGLPFAISQMSGVIRQKHLTLQEFEDWYYEDSKHLHGIAVVSSSSGYKHTISTAWAVDRLSKSALALLKVLSLLDPDRIPEEVLTDGAKDAELKDYPVKKHNFFEARAELIHTSLAIRNMATNELKVHRLVQTVVMQKMSKDETEAAFATVAVLISAVWPWVSGTDPTRNQPWRVPIAERLEAHVCNLERLFGPGIRNGAFSGTAISGCIFSSYSWYTFERGHSAQTQLFGDLARGILEKVSANGSDDEKEVTHWLGEAFHNLSLAGVMTGSSDGLQDVNSWLGILHKRIEKYGLPSDQISLATAHNQMGICLFNKNNTKDAMESFKQSLDAYRTAQDRPNFSGTFPALSLSLIYALQGQPKQAEEVVKPMIEEHEKILGQDDTSSTESGHLYRRMGTIRDVQQRFEEAFHYHQRALKNLRVTLGEKHYFTGDCFYSIALDLIQLGDVQSARKNLDAAIEVFTSASHREAQAARAFWKKACVLRSLGEEAESKALFGKAKKLRCQVAPNDDRSVESFGDEDWNELIVYWSR